jgi:hypothetical protein
MKCGSAKLQKMQNCKMQDSRKCRMKNVNQAIKHFVMCIIVESADLQFDNSLYAELA